MAIEIAFVIVTALSFKTDIAENIVSAFIINT